MSADDGHGRGQAGQGTGLAAAAGRDRRRWLILGIIGLAQLMVVLDGTVRVSITL